jgi:methylmalonyl-CoA mutase N-terminal domain/subunit
MREAGTTAAEEIAFTLSHAIAYVDAAMASGLAVDDFAPRLSFFFACHMDFFEEIAKFRAARRMWARIMRDRFHATDSRSQALRFHTQTGGVTLTAQQPLTNVVRTALEAMSAVLGGTQSLHTNAYDEALGLPSQPAAELALRTQQMLGYETAVPQVADPFGGSYYVENLTDRVEEEAHAIMEEVDERGGAVRCIETGWTMKRIADSAFRFQQRVESGARVVVGVNKYVAEGADQVEIMKMSPRGQEQQIERLRRLRERRAKDVIERHLATIETTARGSGNLLPVLKAALADYVTIGECCGVLRRVFGEYRPAEA